MIALCFKLNRNKIKFKRDEEIKLASFKNSINKALVLTRVENSDESRFWISSESGVAIPMLPERENSTSQGQINSFFLKSIQRALSL